MLLTIITTLTQNNVRIIGTFIVVKNALYIKHPRCFVCTYISNLNDRLCGNSSRSYLLKEKS